MADEVWAEIYDRLAELVRAHRTTLIFVNTRRLAERAARHLAERLGEDAVTAHHGSLAKEHRLNAEERLKAGKLKALVATASLELGIDIGDVDLVCQLGSPHAIATFLQRVGRSGHGLGRVPKGRLFPLSRDDLVECAALLASVRRERARRDQAAGPRRSTCSRSRSWPRSACRNGASTSCTGASRALRPTGICRATSSIGSCTCSPTASRRSAAGAARTCTTTRVNQRLRGRRGARLTAITNGGAIPDQFDYDVVLLPSELPIGTLNEDFAFESMPGDIFQLGNASLPHPEGRDGQGLRRGRPRPAADDSVLARRGAGPQRRALGVRVAPAATRRSRSCSIADGADGARALAR